MNQDTCKVISSAVGAMLACAENAESIGEKLEYVIPRCEGVKMLYRMADMLKTHAVKLRKIISEVK